MNYEELLRKYIDHVRKAEGIDFIDQIGLPMYSDVEFTEAEVGTLKRLASPNAGKGCKKKLAPGQWFTRCGETDMGQTAPALCTECGGEYRLAE